MSILCDTALTLTLTLGYTTLVHTDTVPYPDCTLVDLFDDYKAKNYGNDVQKSKKKKKG